MNPINHVAIIMDGNGRWGLKKKKSRNYGHSEGLKTVEKIIEVTIKNKIKFLTLFAFSSENWSRPKKEIKYLFNLLDNFLNKKIKALHKKDIRFKIIGDRKPLPIKTKKIILSSESLTNYNKTLQINLALNYGSKNEIIDSIKKTIKKKISVNKKSISKNLYTSNMPDPDLLIRTGNTQRLSNFLLWQLSYAEIFFEKKLWPDFKGNDYTKILSKFKKIKRNFGNI